MWRPGRSAPANLTNVTFTGFVPNERIPLYQSAADVLLMPYGRAVTTSSGGNTAEICSPMKMFEYMAAGRAILTSDLPVLREVLDETKAVFSPLEQAEAWESALGGLLANPQRRQVPRSKRPERGGAIRLGEACATRPGRIFMKSLRDLLWILPCSLVLGLVLSLLGPGTWWIGWLAYAVLLALGLWALALLWRSAEASTEQNQSRQAYARFDVAPGGTPAHGIGDGFLHHPAILWQRLPMFKKPAISSRMPITATFNPGNWLPPPTRSGGPLINLTAPTSMADYLFVSSLLYRYLSPDAHRPWLIILLASLTAAIGVALAWKATDKVWGKSMAVGVGWIMVLFPESILLGSSQMREPFLITFIAMAFWGVASWAENHRSAVAWLIGSLAGMLLFSPGIAVISIILLAGWIWLRGKERRIRWWWVAGVGVIVLLSFLLLAWSVGGSLQ